jgi:hypothetical protein
MKIVKAELRSAQGAIVHSKVSQRGHGSDVVQSQMENVESTKNTKTNTDNDSRNFILFFQNFSQPCQKMAPE